MLVNVPAIPSTGQQDDTQTINNIWASGSAAFQAGKIKAARDRFAEFIKMVPFEPSSRIWMARCQAKLGDTDGAIASLSMACELGWEDPQSLQGYEELNVLDDSQELAKVLAGMRENRERQFVQYIGNAVDRTKAAPLVVLFHGRGELPAIQLHFWKEAADRAGWMILALKGTRNVGSVYAWERSGAKQTWEVDTDAIFKKTRKQVTEFIESHQVSQVVLAGFSQGGVAAFEMLCSEMKPRPTCGVLFATAFPEIVNKQLREKSKLVDGQIVVHIGENDRWLKGNQAVVKVLKQAGKKAEIQIWQELGHEMPPDHTQVILDSVGSVLRSR